MPADDLRTRARCLLADRDALGPWRSFVPAYGMTPDEAYALQGEVVRLRVERGEQVVGYKIGCTSQAIRDQLGMREAIFGRLFDSECWPAGSRLSHDRFASLAIEGELAIRIADDLPDATLSDEEYVQAVGSVFPVIELHHYVLPAEANRAAALIASGGMHAGFVVSERETRCSGEVPEVTELDVFIDDRQVGTTEAPWTMGGPAATLRWLSQRLRERGLRLLKGQVILTGSPLPLFPVNRSSRVACTACPLETCSVEIA
jgi:2-keto-4-pentenoate hydratase